METRAAGRDWSRPVRGKAERIKEFVRSELLAREYRPGERFLSNNEFAARFGVNPLTANKIISALAREGFLQRERGRGTFVTEQILQIGRVDAPGIAAVKVGVVVCGGTSPFGAADDGAGSRMWHHPLNVLQAVDSTVAEAGGRTVLLDVSPEADAAPDGAARVSRSGASALLAVSRDESLDEASLGALRATGLPFVVVGARVPEGVRAVVFDDFRIGFDAAEHLSDLGHERLAFAGLEEPYTWDRERLRGFEAALDRRGVADQDRVCVRIARELGRLVPEEFRAALDGPLAGVTGVVCVYDEVAAMLLAAAEMAGRRIPGDISLTGVDDLPHLRQLELTTFQQPGHALGRAGASLLLRCIEDPGLPAVVERVKCPLIPRRTTAPRTAG